MSWLSTSDNPANGQTEPKGRYRVDLYQHQFDFWMEYTHLKRPVTLEMAEALAWGIVRQGCAARIVEVASKRMAERVIKEWSYLALQGGAQ
jgi:hypothetical protein